MSLPVSILLVLGALVFMLPASIPVSAAKITYEATDVGPKIRQWEPTADRIVKDDQQSGGGSATASALTVLDTKIFLILNDYTGQYQATYFDLVADSSKTQVWVQANLAWPAGDSRAKPELTQDQISYILGQFDNNILPKESAYFGTADAHDGSNAYLPSLLGLPEDYYFDSTGRNIVLVSNIRDENYYDSTYPIYIAGFYSPSFETYFDRNIISIDAYDWANRMGPNPHPNPDQSKWRPYLYEGVFAHEWQHLLHDDYDSDEDTFINEGMAEYAEIVCGYTPSLQGHLDAAAANPENSLVVWGDQGDDEILTDYGQAALFQILLNQEYGTEFTQALFHEQANGIAGVNAAFQGQAVDNTFDEFYQQFRLALYQKGSFDLFPDFQVNVGHAGKPNPEAFASPGAPPWGTDYLLVWGYEQIANLKFNGFAFNPITWTSVDGKLWGGTGDLLDNWAIFETQGGGILTFDTEYDIEEFWDFGFVQVSTDDGQTWTSLVNSYTISDHDPSAHPNIIANLPGLTGTSDGTINMSFDLSVYAGQDILVGFRYMTDWATALEGWFIDNIYVDDTLISDGSSTSGFMSLNQVLGISNDYSVSLLGERIRKGVTEYKVLNILDGGFVSDWDSIRQMFDNYTQLLVLVTYKAEIGVASYADYNFQVDPRGGIHIK
ncbi:peptidase M6 [Dehalogenimonas etheniformans]|uniref:Peptidase M6 n=2 Tax=Dehalogenimonas etheniformans TaxID=1536648 RepID=A0A2P5P7B8_9CHLR|nr:peptidase M6 [Dehalogenimonas etheniformans]